MPTPKYIERVNELTIKVEVLSASVEKNEELNASLMQSHEKTLFDLQSKLLDVLTKNAVLEQRCLSLETTATRTWQVWLALIVAGIGLVVAFVKK